MQNPLLRCILGVLGAKVLPHGLYYVPLVLMGAYQPVSLSEFLNPCCSNSMQVLKPKQNCALSLNTWISFVRHYSHTPLIF